MCMNVIFMWYKYMNSRVCTNVNAEWQNSEYLKKIYVFLFEGRIYRERGR